LSDKDIDKDFLPTSIVKLWNCWT